LYKTNVLEANMAIPSDNGMDSGSHKSVHDRLLDVAEELFCEHGFEGTSVRDIAGDADCNIASVNYYFGGKDKLYVEVWRRYLLRMRDMRIASIERVMSRTGGKPTLEELLRSYSNAFLEPLVEGEKRFRFVRLMAREMIDRHLPEGMFVKEMILPVMTVLQKALVQICPGLEESEVQLVILSVVGQLMHVIAAETMFEQSSELGVPRFGFSEIVEHIVAFSAAGIRAYAETKNSKL
jgi:AcrR family transcriptional regulator